MSNIRSFTYVVCEFMDPISGSSSPVRVTTKEVERGRRGEWMIFVERITTDIQLLHAWTTSHPVRVNASSQLFVFDQGTVLSY